MTRRKRLLTGLAAAAAVYATAAVGQTQIPPPPPPTFDPQPGPWMISFKPDSAEFLDDDQLATVRWAVAAWGKHERYSLLLCNDGDSRGPLPFEKLLTVARALYAAGATSVLRGGELCYHLKPSPTTPSEGVMVVGVHEFRDETVPR